MRTRNYFLTALAGLILVAAIASGCTSLDDFQRRVIFRPNKEMRQTPAEYQAKYEDVWLKVAK